MDKLARPPSIPSMTYYHGTGSHSIRVTIGFIDGKPKEVFINTGADHEYAVCDRAWTEALARSVSLGLRYGVPIEEYISQLEGIHCMATSDPDLQRMIASPADYLAQILKIVSHPDFKPPELPQI